MFSGFDYRNVRSAVGDVTERGVSLPVACVATLLLGLLAGFFTVSWSRG